MFLKNVHPAIWIMEFKFNILHNDYLNLNIYCFISSRLYRFIPLCFELYIRRIINIIRFLQYILYGNRSRILNYFIWDFNNKSVIVYQ